MTNEAIGEVTVAIKNLLINGLGNTYDVSLYEPWSTFDGKEGVNLFLYKVEENAHWRNMDWPGDKQNLIKNNQTPLSLDLYYLLTPYTPKEAPVTDEAANHRILGKAMQIMHENSVLNDIHSSYFDSDNNDHFSTNLRNCYEKIKVTHTQMGIDEMSKIWSMGEKPYKLSVAYHVSLIQISPSQPSAFLTEVSEIGLDISTKDLPVVSELKPPSGSVNKNLIIRGSNLWLEGAKTKVRAGELLIEEFIEVNQNQLEFLLPQNLRTGSEIEIIVVNDFGESKPEIFNIIPWIERINPQRFPLNKNERESIPMNIIGSGLKDNSEVYYDNNKIVDADVKLKNSKQIKALLPKTIKNGSYDIKIITDGNQTNLGQIEVVPLVLNVKPDVIHPGDEITIMGQRLKGADIQIEIGSIKLSKKNNTNDSQIKFNIVSTIHSGKYDLTLTVDSHRSNKIEIQISD